jgi:hypothetical protein
MSPWVFSPRTCVGKSGSHFGDGTGPLFYARGSFRRCGGVFLGAGGVHARRLAGVPRWSVFIPQVASYV